MYIFVDESGTFTHSPDMNSWCTVAAYVVPEHGRRHVESLMRRIRALNGGAEAKLKHLTEQQYASFLRELRHIEGVAFAVAVDVGLHRRDAIQHHRDMQAASLLKSAERMSYEVGRRLLTDLALRVGALTPQLYTQLVCQVQLFHLILSRGLMYLVQRHPPSLGHFRWRVDQKASSPTQYEEAFCELLPAMLQTRSIDEPMFALNGADYRHFERFQYGPGEAPTYLKTDYGIDIGDNVANIGKIAGEDFKLVDSSSSSGVQIADLLASGTRRLFRGGFKDSADIATLLGSNFVKPMKGESVVRLGSLDMAARVSDETAAFIRAMGKAAKPMVLR